MSGLDGMSVYGYCPQANCGAPVVSRTRGIPTRDRCAKGHTFMAATTLSNSPFKEKVQTYVCGFMFEPLGGIVVLVEKDRPAWQAGKLNGVGGKIEPGETVHNAMVREFHEEAGVLTQPADWEEFATLVGPDYKVHMMRAFSDDWHRVRTMETEQVRPYRVPVLRDLDTVPNLKFLIPLALDTSGLELPIVFKDAVPDEANAA